MQHTLTTPLVDLFLELCALPSPSGRERAVTDRVTAYLTGLGLEWDEDDAARSSTGTRGTSTAVSRPRTARRGRRSSSALTRTPCRRRRTIEPVVGEDGVVRNAADTILGSDNKAAVVVMLEAVAPHPGGKP